MSHDPLGRDPFLTPEDWASIKDALALLKDYVATVSSSITAAGDKLAVLDSAVSNVDALLSDSMEVLRITSALDTEIPEGFEPSPGVAAFAAEIDGIQLTEQTPVAKQKIAALLVELKKLAFRADKQMRRPDSDFPSNG